MSPDRIDPILAVIDYLHRYRRSRQCWVIGGPAAVDDIAIGDYEETAAVRLRPRALLARAGLNDRSLLPPLEERERASLAACLRTPGRYVSLTGESPTDLCLRIAPDDLPDPRLLQTLSAACSAGPDRASRGSPPSPGPAEARIAYASLVSLRLGDLAGRFGAFGTADNFVGALLGLPDQVFDCVASQVLVWIIAALGGAASWLWGPLAMVVPGIILAIVWADMALNSGSADRLSATVSSTRWRHAVNGPFYRYLRASRHHRPASLAVVAGPDPAAAGLCYALFTHLAAHAAGGDPNTGAQQLDEPQVELARMLFQDREPPRWSATCRLQFPAGPRCRLVHLRLPDDARPDSLCRRVLHHADVLWIVLPEGMPEEEARRHVSALVEATGEIRSIVLIADGVADAGLFVDTPAMQAVLAGRPVRRCALPLRSLRDRYLRGEVSPEDAGRIVRMLAGEIAGPPAAAGAGTADGEPFSLEDGVAEANHIDAKTQRATKDY